MRHARPRHRTAGRAAVAALSLVLVAGTAVATSSATGAAQRVEAAKKPAAGGSFIYRLTTAPDCLDPQKTSAAASNFVDTLVLDPLLSIDAKGHYVGNLATGYKVAQGGLRLTFTLRKNVRFSNGDAFTANDVKFTFDRALNPATKSPVTATYLAAIQSVKVLNKYSVQLQLKSASRPLLTNLTTAYTGILDPKAINAASNTCEAPVGTGLYKIQGTGTAFSDIVLSANKRHNFAPSWVHHKGAPYVSRIEITTITSDATAVSELLSSGVDVAGIPGTQLSRVQGNSKLKLHRTKSTSIEFAELNTASPPFNDPQVRKAFAEIINRKDIVSAAFAGQAQPDLSPLPPAVPFYDKSVAKYMPKFNISDARKIIAAKHATGPYTLLTIGAPPFSTIAEILQQSAAQAGMQFNIVTKGGLGDFLPVAAKGDYNALVLGVGAIDPDILYSLLSTTQGGGKGLNWTGDTGNTKLDNLLNQGRTTLQAKKVAKIYSSAQKLIDQQLEFISLTAPIGTLAIRSNIKGYHANSTGTIAWQDLYIKTK